MSKSHVIPLKLTSWLVISGFALASVGMWHPILSRLLAGLSLVRHCLVDETSWRFVWSMTTRPNEPAAPNPAIASRVRRGHPPLLSTRLAARLGQSPFLRSVQCQLHRPTRTSPNAPGRSELRCSARALTSSAAPQLPQRGPALVSPVQDRPPDIDRLAVAPTDPRTLRMLWTIPPIMGQAFSFRTTPAARFVPGPRFSTKTVPSASDVCPLNQGSALPRTTVQSAANGLRTKTPVEIPRKSDVPPRN